MILTNLFNKMAKSFIHRMIQQWFQNISEAKLNAISHVNTQTHKEKTENKTNLGCYWNR